MYCTVNTKIGPGDVRPEDAELLSQDDTFSLVRFLNSEDVATVHSSRVSDIRAEV